MYYRISIRLLGLMMLTIIVGCESQYTRDVSGVYVPVDSIPRLDTVILTTNIRPDSEGFFLHRFWDSSGMLHSDNGTFIHLSSWSDTPNHLGYLYGVDFSKWVETNDSVKEPIEAMFFKGSHGQLLLSIGIVQVAGHHVGGEYVKVGSVKYQPVSVIPKF